MTAGPRARETPERAASPQPFAGALFVDLDGQRARYECLRPGCPHPLEGPVYSTAIGVTGLKAFIDGIKHQHLAQHHGSPR
ncbi:MULTISPECIES: hypothetical protein [Streptomyces rochei group]|uniref:hypothetical protein n=1 Tax=Streptomyces rochei group TaxID=2867164 RepID=UPI001874A637|nr:hypothetical protein [Streptomyces vinaceusdrappus]GHC28801.1 hypothetical protein GCM10010308_52570 [Streptomyces vinaceusdrappus]